jgi:predicted MPP superfamily phosphohydrolase
MKRSVRTLVVGLLLALAVGLLVGAHAYIVQRLVLDPALPAPWRQAGVWLVVALGASLVAQPIGERLLRPPLSHWIAWPASLWMGVAFWLLLLLGASDLVLRVAGGTAWAADGRVVAGDVAGARAALVCAVVLVAATCGVRSARRPPQHRRVEVSIDRWPRAFDGFRIVQISDIHIGPILGRRFARHVVERVLALRPDLIGVTGDLVDGSARLLAEEVAPFADLEAPYGVYFVTGNHDHLSGAAPWTARIRELGMRVLRNERVEIRKGDAVFDLLGVDDHHASVIGGGGEDLERAFAGRDSERPAVLLAHDPATFRRARREALDLQLSGHTHGGQIWPFGFLVRLAVPWVAGHYRDARAQLYVSRGTGFWGPPMRLFAPAEITEIVIRAAASHDTGSVQSCGDRRAPATSHAW